MSMRTHRETRATKATYGIVNDEATGLYSPSAGTALLMSNGTVDYPKVVENMAIATAMTSRTIFTAPRALKITGATLVYGVVAGQACAVQIEKCTGTTAPGSGTALLTNNANAGFDATATANTVQTGTLTATTASLTFAAGDRLTMKWGTATSCVGACLVVTYMPL